MRNSAGERAEVLQRHGGLAARLLFGGLLVWIVWLAAQWATGGSKTGIVLASIIALSPFAIYAAISRPFVFPFAAYAFLTPFNDILGRLNELRCVV